jgi:hypothetical protein
MLVRLAVDIEGFSARSDNRFAGKAQARFRLKSMTAPATRRCSRAHRLDRSEHAILAAIGS